MRAFLNNTIWINATRQRQKQIFFGRLSGILLSIALVGLFDGLLAQMRTGANELEFLPGQIMTVSGPAVLKNPLVSDLIARFNPEDAPFTFDMEGFFTGYWFGNGMWRGKIIAYTSADPGQYELLISFKGASARTSQIYILKLFADAAALREASLSLIKRWTDINPFILAAITGIAGIVFGIITYMFGRRYISLLVNLGLAEIYSSSSDDASIWCLSPENIAPKPGNVRMVINSEGQLLGEARSEGWHKGKLRLTMLNGVKVLRGSLVCLRPPQIFEGSYPMENKK